MMMTKNNDRSSDEPDRGRHGSFAKPVEHSVKVEMKRKLNDVVIIIWSKARIRKP